MARTDAFLITADFKDETDRCLLEFYGRSTSGKTICLRFTETPVVFFIQRGFPLPVLRGLQGRKAVSLLAEGKHPVDALYFATWRQAQYARRRCQDEGTPVYEGDVKPIERFLMERFIYGGAIVEGTGVTSDGMQIFVNPKISAAADVWADLSSMSFDIETDGTQSQVYSIAWDFCRGPERIQEVVMRGPEQGNHPNLRMVASEADLLSAFSEAVDRLNPDLLLGWHVEGFDLQVLQRLAERARMPLDLGRGRQPVKILSAPSGRQRILVPGRVIIDGPTALRQNFFTFEDYRLESVAQELLGRGKLIAEERDKVKKIDEMYAADRPALAAYNLEDCILVTDIFERLGLISMMQRRVQLSGMLLDQVGRSTAAFDHLMLPRYHRNGYVAPDIRTVHVQEHAAGGHVMDPDPGIYHRVVVLDFKSLYPSLIRTFHIDPLSHMLAGDSGPQVPNGTRFSREQSVLPAVIEDLMEKRANAKKQGDAPLSQAIKILMNSFYGVMGSGGCRFYQPELPTAITSTGKWLLLESRSWLEERNYPVLYGDTDSIFIELPDGFRHWQDEGTRLAEQLNRYWKVRLKDEFDVDSVLEFEFEKAYSPFFLPPVRGGLQGAKKRYAGLRVNSNEPTVEIVGMEAIRSDWTPMARRFQRALFDRLFHEEPLISWMKDWVSELLKGEFDDALVYTKQLRKPLGSYTRSNPPHVKAARLMENPGRRISYVVTRRGPIPAEDHPTDIDYQHYIERQLKPIADQVLMMMGQTFQNEVLSKQLTLF